MKNLILLFLISITSLSVNAQTEWTSTKPMEGYGVTHWYDAGWTARTPFQKGSTWHFKGTYPETTNVDSVICSIGIGSYDTWAYGPHTIDTVIEKNGTADGEYETYLTVPMDWPTVAWQELGSGYYDRPILQTRIGYDTNVFSFGIPPRPGYAYHNLIGHVCDAFTDSLHVYDHILHYNNSESITANVDIEGKMVKGVDSLHVSGHYGVANFESLTIGTYELDMSSWAQVSATVETILNPTVEKPANPGIFDYYYVVDQEFEAVTGDGNWVVIQLVANYTGGITESIWFWGAIIDDGTPESVEIDEDDFTIEHHGNSTAQLHVTVLPEHAVQDVEWSSTHEWIATVDANGLVRTEGVGTTSIYATSVVDPDLYGYIEVTVVDNIHIYPDSIRLDTNSLDLYIDSTYVMSATVYPLFTDYPEVYWYSTDRFIASVNSVGFVVANSTGTAYVVAQSFYADDADTCVINVAEFIPTSNMQLNKDSLEVEVGRRRRLGVTFTPSNASEQNLNWSSRADDIATVNDEGYVKGIALGETYIDVVTDDGEFIDSCYVKTIPYNSLQSTELSNGIQMYPNPANDNIFITGISQGECTITLMNTVGEVISQTAHNVGTDNMEYSLGSLKKGVYIMHIEMAGDIKTVQFSKM